MNRRQMRDKIAEHLVGYLNGSDHEQLCEMAGLDPGATSVSVDARLGEAVAEMCGVLLGSVAGQYRTARVSQSQRARRAGR